MEHLYIFVEGKHDEQFMKQILEKKGCFSPKWRNVNCISYSGKEKLISNHAKISAKNESITTFLLVDADFQNRDHEKFLHCERTCDSLKQYATSHYNFKTVDCIFIVKEEIESWYIAGFSEDFCKRNKMKFHQNTDSLTKELFKQIHGNKTPNELQSLLIKNFNDYSIEEAMKRNQSFKKFYQALQYRLKN